MRHYQHKLCFFFDSVSILNYVCNTENKSNCKIYKPLSFVYTLPCFSNLVLFYLPNNANA